MTIDHIFTEGLAVTGILRTLLILFYIGLLTAAAVIDLRRFIIPNSLVVALLGLWPVWFAVTGAGPVAYTLIGALLVFALGIVCYWRGYMGGGDVKLIAVLALWAGPGGLFPLILYISVAGGVLSICWMSPIRPRLAPVMGWAEGLRDNTHIPYGVAIAAGGLSIAGRLWAG